MLEKDELQVMPGIEAQGIVTIKIIQHQGVIVEKWMPNHEGNTPLQRATFHYLDYSCGYRNSSPPSTTRRYGRELAVHNENAFLIMHV